MRTGSKLFAFATAGCLSALIAGSAAVAAEINVVSTPGPMPEVMGALVPLFEHASGHKVTIKFQAAPATISQLKEGAGIDLLIADEEVINDFVKDGLIAAGGGTRVMLSRVGVAVRAGAPKPDIGSAEALKAALVAAKSVAYSQGASGRHFLTVIARLGLVDTLKPKTVIVQGKPVGAAVAAGEAEIGVQQVAELLAGSRHRSGRSAARRFAEDHRLRGGRSGQGQGPRGRQGIGPRHGFERRAWTRDNQI